MTLEEYEDFVARALFVNQVDPVRSWGELHDFQAELIARLEQAKELRIESDGTDLTLNVKGRTWINSDGKRNMPSGEVFTGPLESSAHGRHHVRRPVVPRRRATSAACGSTFRDGEVVEATAEEGEDYLRHAIAVDEGARRLGEIGVGTNFGIDRPIGHDPLRREDRRHRAPRARPLVSRDGREEPQLAALGPHLRPARRAGGCSPTATSSSSTAASSGCRDRPPTGWSIACSRADSRRGASTFHRVSRRTKIVATIGPASRNPETLRRMVEAGMDVARLNFSHGTPELHAENVQLVRDAAGAAGRPVAVLQDLPGPKLRIGPVRDETVMLESDSTVRFTCGEETEGDSKNLSVGHPSLADAIQPGEVFYLSDGAHPPACEQRRPATRGRSPRPWSSAAASAAAPA